MSKFYPSEITQVASALKKNQVGILPTDTIYGLHAQAFNPKAVEKIYQLKGRDFKKPLIILIADIKDLKLFQVKLSEKELKFLNKIWPGPISVILPVEHSLYSYLHRGTKGLAFRVPNNKFLLKVLKKTGPLVSTSANKEGQIPAADSDKAESYFGQAVDLYVDGGELKNPPSTLVKMANEQIDILRTGTFKSDGLKL
jgi:L-threonylcarbamoyladenylate synthase